MSDDSVRENVAAEWSSSNTTVATIDSSGLVTARQAGGFDIRATAEGLTARLTGVSAVSPPQPKFDDRFWRELVYNAHDKPGDLAGSVSWVMPTASPNVYIRTTNLEPSDVDYMRREIPGIVRQVTGETYAGRIEHGTDEAERRGWIIVRTVTRDQAPEFITGKFCGYARIGADPGKVWLVKEAGCRLSRMLVPELGHALGLYHVGDADAVMKQVSSVVSFSDAERHHGKLAYRAGRGAGCRGAGYCGNPETCGAGSKSFSAAPATAGTPRRAAPAASHSPRRRCSLSTEEGHHWSDNLPAVVAPHLRLGTPAKAKGGRPFRSVEEMNRHLLWNSSRAGHRASPRSGTYGFCIRRLSPLPGVAPCLLPRGT